MPKLVQKFLIYAAPDGLLLRQSGGKGGRDNDIRIRFNTYEIEPVPLNENSESTTSRIEAYGLVGLLDLVSKTYLIAITRRKQVAQIRDKPVYVIKDVTLIPLSSQANAEKAINAAQKYLKQNKTSEPEAEPEESDMEEDDAFASAGDEEKPDEAAARESSTSVRKESSISEKNVVQDKARYGQFAKKWFSKGRSNENAAQKQSVNSNTNLTPELDKEASDSSTTRNQQTVPGAEKTEETQGDQAADPDGAAAADNKDLERRSAIESLKPRIKRSARLYFSSGGFFFSYEHNLSGTLMEKLTLVADLPLWKRYDPQYFWNHHLAKPLIYSGRDELVLPVMQGFVGQRAFSIGKTDDAENDMVAEAFQDTTDVVSQPLETSETEGPDAASQTKSFLLTLISRRSVLRAGLRYLRRGVDADGNVANHVETEQILSTRSWDLSDKAFSLIQIRGSIPLHFTQIPGKLKPTPVTFGSEATNHAALTKHFELLVARYRQVFAVPLVDKHPGPEVSLGESYESHVKKLNDSGGVDGKQIGFEWFDFHSECKGMKFENVSILLDSLESTMKSFGWIVKQHDRNIGQQTGVLRSNCMDCLDRTNVVQQAIARWALEQQLKELGLQIDLKTDTKTQWFNTLWADNGDAISKVYAGSAAMKGDFTRTRKRTWTGAMSDFSLTLTRYYTNMFGDYFLQTCIDYFVGNAGPTIFDEFEADMMTKDFSLNMKRIRQNAIDTCEQIVPANPDEVLVAGWTLSCPRKSNTLRTLPFEECVVLLTNAAFYSCRFDWNTETVTSFERVDLRDITEMWRGAYITNALGPTHLDEKTNVGFALKHKQTEHSFVRSNTRTIENDDEASDEEQAKDEREKPEDSGKQEDASKQKDSGKKKNSSKQKDSDQDEIRILAFKALPPEASAAKYQGEVEMASLSEVDLVKHICDEVQEAVAANKRRQRTAEDEIPKVEEQDVISVKKAKQNTGYMESIGYSLKRLVWS